MRRRLGFLGVVSLAIGLASQACYADWGFTDQIQICNDSEVPLSTAYVARDSNGFRSTWRAKGWFNLDPGECRFVLELSELDDVVEFWATAEAIVGGQVFPLEQGEQSFCVSPDRFDETDVSESSLKTCARGKERRSFLKRRWWNGDHEGGIMQELAYRISISQQSLAYMRAEASEKKSDRSATAPSRPPSPPRVPTVRLFACTATTMKWARRQGEIGWSPMGNYDCASPAGKAVKGCQPTEWLLSRLSRDGDKFVYNDQSNPDATERVEIDGNLRLYHEVVTPHDNFFTEGSCQLVSRK